MNALMKTSAKLLLMFSLFMSSGSVIAHGGPQVKTKKLPPLVIFVFNKITPDEFKQVKDEIILSGGMLSINFKNRATMGRLPNSSYQTVLNNPLVNNVYYEKVEMSAIDNADTILLDAIKSWNAYLDRKEALKNTPAITKAIDEESEENALVNDSFTVEENDNRVAQAVKLKHQSIALKQPDATGKILQTAGKLKGFLISGQDDSLTKATWVKDDAVLKSKLTNARKQVKKLPPGKLEHFSFLIKSLNDDVAIVNMVNSKGVPTATIYLKKSKSGWLIDSLGF